MKKLAERYMNICAQAYTEWNGKKLVFQSCFQDEVDFHRMHLELIKRSNGKRERCFLDERYPFVKLNGKWFISQPKLYLYLFGARRILAGFDDEYIQRIHDGVQEASSFYDKSQELEDSLRPRTHVDYVDYQRKMTELYENHLMAQMRLFDMKTPV